jgi:hypothetical protein
MLPPEVLMLGNHGGEVQAPNRGIFEGPTEPYQSTIDGARC